jgi:hypothetical protein
MWKTLRQPLSPKQLVTVVALLLLMTGLLYGLYRGIAAIWHRGMLERSIPAALAGVRAQREALVGAIETYKSHFGYYPPMFTGRGPERGVLNPLCYELLGVRFDQRRHEFFIPTTKDALSVDEVQKYFNMRFFSNCLVFPDFPTNFLSNRPLSFSPLVKDADVFGVGLGYTEFTPESFWEDFEYSPWRYATNPAEHNPGKYDVWVEVKVAGKQFTIGNWPEVR